MHVVVENDSLTTVQLIQNGCLDSHPCKSLKDEIQRCVDRVTRVQVQPVFREASYVADYLAHWGHATQIRVQ